MIAATAVLAGCAGGSRPAVPSAGRYDETGYATWYGEEAAGHLTASGQPFDPAGMTAAHRTLPLGSTAEVTDLATGRRVLVLVDDRGPHDRSRLIDLSRGAAQALGTDRRPLARVRVRLVSDPASAVGQRLLPRASRERLRDGPTMVQVAAFSSEPRARALAAALGGTVDPVGRFYRVRLGPFASATEAARARDVAVARGYGDAAVVDAH
ncbi:septal ring lytic transglycosylase RlpA family protein [uncultured Sphingomonas sp.]|uniref:septal ring lytic transglycosylase RlpA family protein n=1 Tax=uncultured Sphingomonas sp. TaxID=158754 RepID=UPI0035CB3A10